MSTHATKKPTRRFKAAPPRLREIIELVNLVGPRDPMPEIDYQPPPLSEDPTNFVTAKEAELERALEGLPKRFQAYVVQPDRPFLISGAVQRYDNIRVWRSNLKAIAKAGKTLLIKLDSALYVVCDLKTGERTIVPDRFRAAIEEDGVDIDYIRECGVCSRIYYEDRLYYKGERTEPACQYHGQALRSRRNYRPVKTGDVEHWLKYKPRFKRSEDSVKELAEHIGATIRQTNLALDYIERKQKRAKPAPKR